MFSVQDIYDMSIHMVLLHVVDPAYARFAMIHAMLQLICCIWLSLSLVNQSHQAVASTFETMHTMRSICMCGSVLDKAPPSSQHSLHAGNNGLHAKPDKRSAAIETLAVWQNRAAVAQAAGSVKQNV